MQGRPKLEQEGAQFVEIKLDFSKKKAIPAPKTLSFDDEIKFDPKNTADLLVKISAEDQKKNPHLSAYQINPYVFRNNSIFAARPLAERKAKEPQVVEDKVTHSSKP